MENSWMWQKMANLVRAESMNVGNDPRFFAANVMDKRLAALKVLTIVNSLMFGTAIKQCFTLRKDMDFSAFDPLVFNIAYWQFGAFLLDIAIAIMCLLSLYIIAHQLFYAYRLMTAGPSGFDQAAIFYLTRSITMWRHFAIKCLFNGLLMFLGLVAVQLLVQFYKDADGKKDRYEEVVIMNLKAGHSESFAQVVIPVHHKLDMRVHVCLGYIVLGICVGTAVMMIYIRKQHLAVFKENYKFCTNRTFNVQATLREMSHRSGNNIET